MADNIQVALQFWKNTWPILEKNDLRLVIKVILCYSVMHEDLIKSKFLVTSMAILSEQGQINNCRILVLEAHDLHKAWHKLACCQIWLDLIYSLQKESPVISCILRFSIYRFLLCILLIFMQVESTVVLWLATSILWLYCICFNIGKLLECICFVT